MCHTHYTDGPRLSPHCCQRGHGKLEYFSLVLIYHLLSNFQYQTNGLFAVTSSSLASAPSVHVYAINHTPLSATLLDTLKEGACLPVNYTLPTPFQVPSSSGTHSHLVRNNNFFISFFYIIIILSFERHNL